MGIYIVSAIVAAVGAGLLWYRQKLARELALMAGMETSRAADVARMTPGTQVEVKGTLRCAAPLSAEFSQRPCAYYLNTVHERWTRLDRDSKGRTTRRTEERQVAGNCRHALFEVEDASGRVRVDSQQATVEAIQAFSRFDSSGGSLGGAIASLVGAGSLEGYQYREHILPPDIPLYVLGTVQPDGSIGPPPHDARNRTFVVSHKSEEQRQKELESTRTWLLVGACILLVLAIGIVAWFSGPAQTDAQL